jgi:hypothetical protein
VGHLLLRQVLCLLLLGLPIPPWTVLTLKLKPGMEPQRLISGNKERLLGLPYLPCTVCGIGIYFSVYTLVARAGLF